VFPGCGPAALRQEKETGIAWEQTLNSGGERIGRMDSQGLPYDVADGREALCDSVWIAGENRGSALAQVLNA